MMAANRATDGMVRGIIDIPTSRMTKPFIDAANVVVNKVLAGKGLSTEQLTIIESWLAAHFMASSVERQPLMEKIGATQVDYGSRMNIGSDLESTSYGRTVKILDTTGTMANLGKRLARLDTIEALGFVREN